MGLALEQALVQGHDHGVLVGLFDDGHIVRAVDALGTGSLGADAGPRRLAAAHDAAPAAGHHLNEVIVGLAPLHLLHNIFGVDEAADHADVQAGTLVVKAEFLDGVVTPDTALGDLVQGPLVVLRNETAQHRLRDAAGDAEDHAAAGAEAEGS